MGWPIQPLGACMCNNAAIVGAMSVSPTRRRVAPCRIPQPMKSRGT
ncbi:hypothetical protein [Odoribacter splanchnicus]|nr:hypothetical protein [Odoribacter splanchnicus]